MFYKIKFNRSVVDTELTKNNINCHGNTKARRRDVAERAQKAKPTHMMRSLVAELSAKWDIKALLKPTTLGL